MIEKRQEREKGMMTVEAVLSLVPFVIVIVGIISFINIFLVHNRIQYAMYQVGSELTAYTYFYEALGVRSGDKAFMADQAKYTEPADAAIEDVSKFIGNINSLRGGVSDLPNSLDFEGVYNTGEQTVESGKSVIGDVKGFVQDPMSLLRSFTYLGLEKGEEFLKAKLVGFLADGMLESYIATDYLPAEGKSADEFLRAFGVKDGMDGLNYDNSMMFGAPDQRNIDIVVEYDIEVYFIKLFSNLLGSDFPGVHVVQRVCIPAWLDGDGVKYTKAD